MSNASISIDNEQDKSLIPIDTQDNIIGATLTVDGQWGNAFYLWPIKMPLQGIIALFKMLILIKLMFVALCVA